MLSRNFTKLASHCKDVVKPFLKRDLNISPRKYDVKIIAAKIIADNKGITLKRKIGRKIPSEKL